MLLIWFLRSENLLGVEIDKKKSIFDKHIYDLSKETNRRISGIARDFLFRTLSKTKLLMNALFILHCGYFHLIWMCHSRKNKKRCFLKDVY